jgi:hypothetical protein
MYVLPSGLKYTPVGSISSGLFASCAGDDTLKMLRRRA